MRRRVARLLRNHHQVVGDHHEAMVRGMANHAGTTPMADRQNALIAVPSEAAKDELSRERLLPLPDPPSFNPRCPVALECDEAVLRK